MLRNRSFLISEYLVPKKKSFGNVILANHFGVKYIAEAYSSYVWFPLNNLSSHYKANHCKFTHKVGDIKRKAMFNFDLYLFFCSPCLFWLEAGASLCYQG